MSGAIAMNANPPRVCGAGKTGGPELRCCAIKHALILILVLAIVAVVVSVNAQPALGQHGQAGVQLSIRLTNAVFTADSTVSCILTVTNKSDSEIVVAEGFQIGLKSESGKEYQLMRPPVGHLSRNVSRLKSGEIHEWNISAHMPKEIPPGNYLLRASGNFSTQGRVSEMMSNAVDIKVAAFAGN